MRLPRTTQPTCSITHLAATTGVAAHTLRWYERMGLLGDVPRDGNGRRRYQAHHARRLQLISDLQSSGMTLADIRNYLDDAGSGSCHASMQALRRQREKLRQEIGQLHDALERIDGLLAGLDLGQDSM